MKAETKKAEATSSVVPASKLLSLLDCINDPSKHVVKHHQDLLKDEKRRNAENPVSAKNVQRGKIVGGAKNVGKRDIVGVHVGFMVNDKLRNLSTLCTLSEATKKRSQTTIASKAQRRAETFKTGNQGVTEISTTTTTTMSVSSFTVEDTQTISQSRLTLPNDTVRL